MARPTHLAASLLAVGLASGCSGPLKTSVPAGIVYECDRGGSATIRYNGGGFLPDSRVQGTGADGQPAQVPRSTAELVYDGATHRMIAEWAEQGLRYRSEEPVAGAGYLIWTQHGEDPERRETWTRPGGPRGAEDIRIGWRAALVPESPEAAYGVDPGEGSDHALCRRAGRVPSMVDVPEEPAPSPASHHR